MSPQFVDFNGDGKLDVLAGTFDGSPHVALAGDGGWGRPERILDKEGKRIVLNRFWNDEVQPAKWDDTKRCDPANQTWTRSHLTSAFATDWDADGDLDLLLGDYAMGHLFLRRNEGSQGLPAFAVRNEVVLADGKPLQVNKTATPRMIDVDGDRLLDLVVGSMGDSYGTAAGGSVHWFRNTGKKGKPQFGPGTDLVPASEKKLAATPTRPDVGLYMDMADIDGDGDLDLLVGSYSYTTPGVPPAETTAGTKKRPKKSSKQEDEQPAESAEAAKPIQESCIWIYENLAKKQSRTGPRR